METDIVKKTAAASAESLTCHDDSTGDQKPHQEERLGKDHANDDRPLKRTRQKHLSDLLSQQQKFAAHLMSSQEEERTAVAREMHEDLGQLLAAIQMNVLLMSNEYGDHARFVARTAVIDQLIAESIMKVQKISSGLRPVMLDLLGLAAAMEWYSQKFQQKTGILCKTTILLKEKRVDRELSTSVFRIFQEVLTNITRHSAATSVQVELTDRKGCLVLLVRDDGRGISKKEKKNHLSFGIETMRQRAEAFGGKLRIFGVQQRGTVLVARIPLTRKGDHHAGQDNSCR